MRSLGENEKQMQNFEPFSIHKSQGVEQAIRSPVLAPSKFGSNDWT